MTVVQTADLVQGVSRSDDLQVYNGLDCCLTLEVFEALQTLFNEEPETYKYERAMQGPLLEIMLRGFAIDEVERRSAIAKIDKQLEHLYSVLNAFSFAVWDHPLNPRSPDQLKKFFYGTMHLPEQWTSIKGQRKLSMSRETLEKLEIYFHARPIIATILAIRDLTKQKETLETEIDPDGRYRTSYNIAGTETWRLSSSSNAFGTGGNAQNWRPDLRRIFIADKGKKLGVIDLKQAESYEVGWLLGILFGDWSYLDACEGADLHTTTARLIWRDLPWTPDITINREIADQPFYRQFSYRDMSKRGGHGTVYFGTPWTMSRHLKVPVRMMEDFQNAFFAAFPGIPRWHRWVADQLQNNQSLTTPFGQTRHFFGRPNDETTLREAIAFSPQSSTAVRTNLGLIRHWTHFRAKTQLLAQTHDSITFQYEESDEQEIIPVALALMDVELCDSRSGRRFTVPGEAKIGWNWAAFHDKPDLCKIKTKHNCIYNPDGLIKFNSTKPDLRTRSLGLQRVFS